MLSYAELNKGVIITINDQPYEIVEAQSTFKGRGHSYLQMKLKNLINGTVIAKTAQPRDSFEEAEIEKQEATFIYNNKGKYVFSEKENSSKRFELDESLIGDVGKFLKSGEVVTTIVFRDKIINIVVPIKVSLKVVEVPPGIKGDRAQSGNKSVTIETGVKINAPLFINEGDIIEINTESGEYVRRVNE
ncbi:MAG: elongation factor P [Candidatus Pacebacteria bacterium]|jgi:elongation factor P|nr:elongation factor P [Candidatus Paceibacterota bacterium]MDD2757092.1 elongation factor P [Candidatus Paceibacterota bacterium]MDD3283712.1 elongation factor P [Candidatus Paceibacterota bacterium]MDD3969813.1 elongation factor P [Candidatus Paceibacterota bacterium]MDD4737775.1 elongation factor P [Candidatus Paceibacterota bacterium]